MRNEVPKWYKEPICRGSFALGTACGHCEKCRDQKAEYERVKAVRETMDGTAHYKAEIARLTTDLERQGKYILSHVQTIEEQATEITRLTAERDAALKEQDRLARAWEAKHEYQVKQSKNHADYFDKSQRRMHELVAERDEALAQVAVAIEMAAQACEQFIIPPYIQVPEINAMQMGRHDAAQKMQRSIRALTPDDAKATLDKLLHQAEAKGMREAAEIAYKARGPEIEPESEWVLEDQRDNCRDAILARAAELEGE